jgi:hypothetical protein
MGKRMTKLVAAAAVLAAGCAGQNLSDAVNFRSASIGGLHVYGVSVFSGYSTTAFPFSGISEVRSGLGSLKPDLNYGVSAAFGWQRLRERSSVAVMYSGSYTGMRRYTDLSGANHSLTLSAARVLNRKWTLTLSGAGIDATMAQFLFQPMAYSVAAQLPATFDDLAAAFAVGKFDNAQIASMLTGAPILQSPARSLLLGNRVMSYSARASISYAATPRLTFHGGSFSAGGQTRPGKGQESTGENYLMPRSLGLSGGGGFSYSLSPRTQIGVDAEEQRVVNRYQRAYTTSANASFGRKMSEHWFLRMYGGGAFNKVTDHRYGQPKQRQWVGGGALGFQTWAHTLLASYDRSAMDSYGLAVGSNTSMLGSWNYHRRDASWNLFASGGQQQVRSTGYVGISGWEASTGWSKRLTGHVNLSAQYVYMNSKSSFGSLREHLRVHSVRLSLGWAPQPQERP